jgi:hypothetical protein
MSDQSDTKEPEQLNQVTERLAQSLGRCRDLVDDCRSKLAANSNEAEADGEDQSDSG